MRRFLAGCLLVCGGLLAGPAAWAAPPAELAREVRTEGPFALGPGPERTLTVRGITERIPEAPPGAWGKTLTRYEVADGRGRRLYLENLPVTLDAAGGFDQEVEMDAALVRGGSRRFLLIRQHVSPSAPNSGTSYHLFGFDARGRFKRFGGSIGQTGEGLRNPIDPVSRTLELIEGKYLEFGEWTGTFSLILRRQFLEREERFELAGFCGPVQVEPRTPEEGAIPLYAMPGPRAARETVRVRPDSRIDFLEGCLGYGVRESDRYVPWLRIRIDGKSGWVPPEEVSKLGLPEAG
jgi:hypothetical protein